MLDEDELFDEDEDGPQFATYAIPKGDMTNSLISAELLRGTTKQSERLLGIICEAWQQFAVKNSGYGEPTPEDLGSKGQYADMHRKWKRLRGHLWDGEPWPAGGETFEQVMFDFFGHLLLTIDFKRQRL